MNDVIEHPAVVSYIDRTMQAIAGRPPRQTEAATYAALMEASYRAYRARTGKLITVSAPTGWGKTKGSLALLVKLAEQGRAGALVLPEIGLIEEQYKDLIKLIPADWVALGSSLHKPNARLEIIAEQRSRDVVASKHNTPAELKAARIVLTTHQAWLAELGKVNHNGWVYNWTKGQRDVVIIDEEPKDAEVYSFTAADVARLCELLGGAPLSTDARAHGFSHLHHASEALRAIEGRMRPTLDEAGVRPLIEPVMDELVTFEEGAKIRAITREELFRRVIKYENLSELEVNEVVTEFERLLKGLSAASSGRVFFARGGAEGSEGGASFWAYDWGVKIPTRTICLDGTVDLDKMRAATRDVVQVNGMTPNYDGTEVHLIDIPAEVQAAKPRKGRFNKRADIERDVFGWLKQFVLTKSIPGDKVLVYWKRSLHEMDFEGAARGQHKHTCWEGREVHFASFGSGKGSNDWNTCNVYIQFDHFYLPRGAYVARLGAVSGETLSEEYLKRLAKNNVKDKRLEEAKTGHILVRTKQESARTAIRNFDDNGLAQPCRLYLIGLETDRLAASAAKMWPGATVFYPEGSPKVAAKVLAKVIREGTGRQLTIPELLKLTGIRKQHLNRAVGSRLVQEVMVAMGWSQEKLTRGWRLIRQ